LRDLWKTLPFPKLVKSFPSRTANAVYKRSRVLKLESYQRPLTIGLFCDRTGYARSRVLSALYRLKITVTSAPRTSGRYGTTTRFQMLTALQQQKVIAYLRAIPDGERLYSGKLRTRSYEWGTGDKPACCIACRKTEHPHRAHGSCTLCYPKVHRIWGRFGNAPSCKSCSTKERCHYAKGLCRRCALGKRDSRPQKAAS
jgi:hypothetical protein